MHIKRFEFYTYPEHFHFSLVAGPAIVATGKLGEHSNVLDPSGTRTLTSLGNHLLAQELADYQEQSEDNVRANLPPPPDPSFLSRVPALDKIDLVNLNNRN